MKLDDVLKEYEALLKRQAEEKSADKIRIIEIQKNELLHFYQEMKWSRTKLTECIDKVFGIEEEKEN